MNRMRITLSLLILLFVAGMPAAQAAPKGYHYVRSVFDGDTVLLNNGLKVRLLGINTPEINYKNGKAEPFAYKAKARLERLTDRTAVRLEYDKRKTDKYGRELAHLYTKDGLWLNKALVEEGLAHVYSFPENTKHVDTLLTEEAKAQVLKKGLWSHKKWRTFNASNMRDLEKRIGEFTIVEGTVSHANQVGNKFYINFGKNWRQDFTIQLNDRYKRNFSKEMLNKLKTLEGLKVKVRGKLIPINGPMISITHPQQLTIID